MNSGRNDAMTREQKIAHLILLGMTPVTYCNSWWGMHNASIFVGWMNDASSRHFCIDWETHLAETNESAEYYECDWDKVPLKFLTLMSAWGQS